MTPAETLRAASEAGDAAAIQVLLAEMPEADRAELVSVARDIVAATKREGIDAARHLDPTLLIAYGLLPVSDIRKLGWRTNWIPDGLVNVLRRRSQDRLIPIVEHLLDDVGGRPAWRAVRPLVQEEIVPRPDRPSYTITMLSGVAYDDVDALKADDPGLLDVEVWHLFEVEGGGENSLANYEKFHGDRWGAIFRDLAARDPRMRERLLDASLAALARDFSTYRAGWFSRFHETLAPTDDERSRRADAYLGLLRSRVGPTVSLAVAALARIQQSDRLPPEDLLERIAPVLVESPVGTAKAGLGLVGRAGTGSTDLARQAAIVATDALANASPDIQRAAIVLIGRLVGAPDEAVARAVVDRLADIAASQRSAAVALIALLGGEPVAGSSTTPASHPDVAIRQSRSPIDPDRAIEPVTSIEALVDLAVSVLETGEPADDIERVLDAVGTLGADRPEQFVRLTAPIAKRARTILARRDSYPFTGFDSRADIAAVLLAWATGELAKPDTAHPSVDPGAGAFLSARAREVAAATAGGRSFVAVAAPTHLGGWIDPALLVRRLNARQPASKLDLVAAILRLSTDGRDDARGAAAGLTGEVGAVVRYALGGDEQIGSTAAWWVAAARVRGPGEDDVAVEKRHSRLGPDAGRAARIRLRLTEHVGRSTTWTGLALETEPPPPARTSVEFPTVLMLHDPSSFSWTGRSGPAMFRWIATVQPGYREVWSAIGSLLMGRNVDWWSAEWANRAFLEPFLDPVTPVGPHARVLLSIALGAKEAGERGLATDVVRLALGDGRLTGPSLAEGLTATVAVACDRPSRWALSLADVAAESDGHAASVAGAIALTLAALVERPPAKLVPLLRLLDELLAGSGTAPAEAARGPLERVAATGGQAGRLARSILARG